VNRHKLLGQVLMVGWLTVIWLALWGSITGPNIVTGIMVSGVLVLVIPPLPIRDDPFTVHPIAALSLLLWFAWALVVSNVSVAREVLTASGRSSIRIGVVACPLRTRSGRLATIIAHAITLTPGTLTVDARGRPAVLFVHVLAFEDAEATRAEVADLERRVVDAFGTDDERQRICGRSPSRATTVVDTDATPEDVS